MTKLDCIMVRLITFLLISISIFSCKPDEVAITAPDVSHIPMEVELIRFDKELINANPTENESSLDKWKASYPEFTQLYFRSIVPMSNDSGEVSPEELQKYLQDTFTQFVMDTVSHLYPDLTLLKKDFTQAFKYMKYYFPSFEAPRIYTLTSNFNYQRFLFDDSDKDGMGIGLDMYLGGSFLYKNIDPQNPNFSDYLTRSFDKNHIVRNSIELLMDELPQQVAGVRMLDIMVANGVKLYLLKKVLPTTHDSIIMEYSAKQIEWCKANELAMWQYFIDEKLLYETNISKINKYINVSPNSPGMPEVAPGRTANYIGYRIVETYMRKFPNTKIEDLLAITDTQGFLEKSKYRPKNK